MLAATGKYVLFTDADLSAPIEEASKLLDVAVNDGMDVVIGSRAIDRSYIEKHQSRYRELGGIVFNFMVRLLLGLRLHDTQCGFKLFHRQKSRRIFEKQTTSGFGFDPELLFLAKRQGLKICEKPVRWSHAEGSKIRFLRDGYAHVFRSRANPVERANRKVLMTLLSVNIDHIATIREARRTNEPDPVAAAAICELAGAHGITVHLRGDRRHIQHRDVKILGKP